MTSVSKTQQNKRRRLAIRALICLLAFALICFFCYQVRAALVCDMRAQAASSIENTILTHAVQCYAIEGAYPESLEYLEQNYGLQINHRDYFVTYEVFATNLMPEVKVLEKP